MKHLLDGQDTKVSSFPCARDVASRAAVLVSEAVAEIEREASLLERTTESELVGTGAANLSVVILFLGHPLLTVSSRAKPLPS